MMSAAPSDAGLHLLALQHVLQRLQPIAIQRGPLEIAGRAEASRISASMSSGHPRVPPGEEVDHPAHDHRVLLRT